MRQHWTIEQSEGSNLEKVTHFAGVGLDTGVAFHDLGTDRVIVEPQDGHLRELLEAARNMPGERIRVVYEKTNLGLLRRWSHLDLAHYGTAVEFHP